MELTIINPLSNKILRFIDRPEINERYPDLTNAEKEQAMLLNKEIEFINVEGLYNLPENNITTQRQNYTNNYTLLGNYYSPQVLSLSAIYPLAIVENGGDTLDYINATMFQQNHTLILLWKVKIDGKIKNYKRSNVSCISQPFSDEAGTQPNQNLEFQCGESGWLEINKPVILSLSSEVSEDLQFPYAHGLDTESGREGMKFEEKLSNPNDTIIINSEVPADMEVIMGNSVMENPSLRNVSSKRIDSMGYEGLLTADDKVAFNTKNQTLRKNGELDLPSLTGDFFKLQIGINNLKFTAENFGSGNPICVIIYWVKRV